MWQYSSTLSEPTVSRGGTAEPSLAAHSPMLDDIRAALQQLTQQITDNHSQVASFFDGTRALSAGRAPARLDVMGGIADYSGSTVLQLPLRESAVVFTQQTEESVLRIISAGSGGTHELRSFHAPMTDFFHPTSGELYAPSQIREYFTAQPEELRWAAYFAGVLILLMHEYSVRPKQGLVIYGYSTVPEGKGISSSAAIEVATMRALAPVLGLTIDAHQQAVLCQQVENQVVGAPCGLMDQMTSSMGRQGMLLNMLCQPDLVREPLQLPKGLSVWGIDSGLRHAVSGADYGAVRTGAFMGYRLMLEQAGIAAANVPATDIVDTRWHGYLANVSVSEFTESFAHSLPQSLTGREFLQRFDDTTDPVTTVDPARDYAVLNCTSHPVHEHFRVRLFMQMAMQSGDADLSDDAARLMGECMYLSHASYGRCGLGSQGTDDLVNRLRRLGPEAGIFGARITGGGNGGTVAVLADEKADDVIRGVATDYKRTCGIGGQVFSGSSDGACSVWLQPSA